MIFLKKHFTNPKFCPILELEEYLSILTVIGKHFIQGGIYYERTVNHE